jgi:1,2-diacylglycerol 3-alpha-glucosyltransferase
MKIAICTDTFAPQINGVASLVMQSALGLARLGHEVTVYAPSHRKAKKNSLSSESDAHYPFAVKRIPSLPFIGYSELSIPSPFFTLWKLFSKKGGRPDIIHVHTPFTIGWEAVIAGMLLRIPVVGTHHTFFDHYLKHVKLDFAFTRALSWKYVVLFYNRTKMVISPSKALASDMVRYGLSRQATHLANAIDTELFSPASVGQAKSGKSITYMGRLSYEKSIDVVLEAFARITLKHANVRCAIIGDGPDRPRLERLARELGIASAVDFLGYKKGKELVASLHRHDVFVTASLTENMPMSVLEALSSGLPVVAIDALGMPEIVKHQKNGLLIPHRGSHGDMVSGLSDGILQIIEDDHVRGRLAKGAREFALSFGTDTMCRALEELYQSTVKSYKKK